MAHLTKKLAFTPEFLHQPSIAIKARNPKFSERKEQLKLTPNIAARRTIVASLGDVNTAKMVVREKRSRHETDEQT